MKLFRFLFLMFFITFASLQVKGKEHFVYRKVTVINLTDHSLKSLIKNQIEALGLADHELFILIKNHCNQTSDLVNKDNLAIAYPYKDANNLDKKTFVVSLHQKMASLNKRKVKEILRHEMKHVQQFYTGRLETLDEHTVRFDGQIIHVGKTEYLDRIYEQEAIAWEKGKIIPKG